MYFLHFQLVLLKTQFQMLYFLMLELPVDKKTQVQLNVFCKASVILLPIVMASPGTHLEKQKNMSPSPESLSPRSTKNDS